MPLTFNLCATKPSIVFSSKTLTLLVYVGWEKNQISKNYIQPIILREFLGCKDVRENDKKKSYYFVTEGTFLLI